MYVFPLKILVLNPNRLTGLTFPLLELFGRVDVHFYKSSCRGEKTRCPKWDRVEGCVTTREENKLIEYWCHQIVDTLQDYTKESLACRLNTVIISCPPERLKNKSSLCIL